MSDEKYHVDDEHYWGEPDVVESDEQIPEDFFEEERRDLLDRIDTLEALIKQRKDLMYSHLEKITNESLLVSAELSHTKDNHFLDKKRLDGLVKTLFQLEQQERLEKIGGFKDMWLLLKELMILTDEYQKLKRAGKL